MFEEYTYKALLADVLKNAPADIDKRQGSIFYDAVAGTVAKIAELYADIGLVGKLVSVVTAVGNALDLRAGEHGITRLAATPAKYKAVFTGTDYSVPVNARFYYNGIYFVTEENDDGMIFVAEIPGENGNKIIPGTIAVPVNTISGLESSTFGDIVEYGTNAETDEALRERIRIKIKSPSENGNKDHYRTWSEGADDSIGRARIFPLWNGPNTVLAILVDQTGHGCSEEVVEKVQRYIDPNDLGMTTTVNGKVYNVGDGLGEGVANIGAHFTASSAEEIGINISVKVKRNSGTVSGVTENINNGVTDILRHLALEADDNDSILVRRNLIGSLILNIPEVDDYEELMIGRSDGDLGYTNLTLNDKEIPVLGIVTVTDAA